jgi:hypothetical protein
MLSADMPYHEQDIDKSYHTDSPNLQSLEVSDPFPPEQPPFKSAVPVITLVTGRTMRVRLQCRIVPIVHAFGNIHSP